MQHSAEHMSPESFNTLYNKCVQQCQRASSAMPWESPVFYANWVGQFYYFVAHATRLLCAAGARLGIDQDVAHIRFLDHCQEEKHHEKLLLKDLEGLKTSLADHVEHPLTAQLYQSQYYLVEHHEPLALMGSILYLEGMSLSVGQEVKARILVSHGMKACHFINLHVGEDVDHMAKAQKLISTLTPKQLWFIGRSVEQTAFIYESLLDILYAKSSATGLRQGRTAA